MLIRALIVLLLVLNLGVALWWSMRTPPIAVEARSQPPGVARLQLVSEVAGSSPALPAGSRNRAAEAALAAPMRDLPRVCVSLGPFADADATARAREQLMPQVLRVDRREVYAGQIRGWNVMLPRFATLEEAQAAAARVQAAGFSDYFVVRDGPSANSLALGRYGAESSAKRRVAELTAAGFPARLEPIGGVASYWLDISANAPFDADAAQARVGALQQQPLECPSTR